VPDFILHFTANPGREDYAMLDENGLSNHAEDSARLHIFARFYARLEIPFFLSIKGRQSDASRDVGALGLAFDYVERPLNAVVYLFNQTWSKFDA